MTTTTSSPKLTKQNYRAIIGQNLADLDTLLGDLEPNEWNEPSLCEGWRVRDVVGHLLLGTAVPIRTAVGKVLAGGGRLNTVVGRESRAMGSAHEPHTLLAMLRAERQRPKLRGLAGKTPPKVLAADTATHLLDVSMALGRPSGLDSTRLEQVLAVLPSVGRWGTDKRGKRLRLVATDIGWSGGRGPEVRSGAEELIVSLGGRPQFAHRLAGPGASTLVDRIGGRS